MATITLSEDCELELTSIISLSELKLQKNFRSIAETLQRFEQRFLRLNTCFQQQSSRIEQLDRHHTKKHTEMSLNITVQVEQLKEQITKKLEGVDQGTKDRIEALEKLLGKDQLDTIELRQKHETLDALVKEDFKSIREELVKTNDMLNYKHDRAEGDIDKIRKQLGAIAMGSLKRIQILEEKNEMLDIKFRESLFAKDYKDIAQALTPFISLPEPIRSPSSHSREAPRRSSYIGSPSEESVREVKHSLNEAKMRIDQFESYSKQAISKMIEKINNDSTELKTFKNEIKRELAKQRNESSSTALLERIQEIRPELNKLYARLDSMEDKTLGMDRRSDETRRNLGELTLFVKENSLHKYQEKIKNLQGELFTQLKDVNQRIDSKTNLTDFARMCQLYDDKIKDINESLSTKCEKVEVKKALLFIESKIKEIILVISEDEENEKDALISKKYIKCISCDKDLDKFSGLVSTDAKNWNMMPVKDLQTDSLGKFGITKYGSLAKKLKRLEGNDLPVLRGGGKQLTQ